MTAIVEEKPAGSLWKRRQFVRSVVAQFVIAPADGNLRVLINYAREMRWTRVSVICERLVFWYLARLVL